MPVNTKKSGDRARKAILQKMLDLCTAVCAIIAITSEKVLFFCKGTGCNALRTHCACAFRPQRYVSACGRNGTGKTEGGVYFYGAG